MLNEEQVLGNEMFKPIYQHLLQIRDMLAKADVEHQRMYKIVLNIHQIEITLFDNPLKTINESIDKILNYTDSNELDIFSYQEYNLTDLYELDKKLVEVIRSFQDLD